MMLHRVIVVAVFISLLSTIVIAQSNILSGDFSVGTQTEGWTLDKGSDTRVFTIFVLFEVPFETAPDVSISVLGIDSDKDANLRYKVKIEKVTTAGMTIKISTWADSKLYLVEGKWKAIERQSTE